MVDTGNNAYAVEHYVKAANKYDTGYNSVPVLPYIDGYFEQEKRMMNIGLNAYMGIKKIERHPEEQKYHKMWRKWCENHRRKQVGGDDGTWAFHAHLGKQSTALVQKYGIFGQYWLDFVRIYLPSREGNREGKVKTKLLETSYSLLETELNHLHDEGKLPHIVFVYGNKVWDHGIIPFVYKNAERYTFHRKFRFCRIQPKEGNGHVTAFCRLSHPASFKKASFYDAHRLFSSYHKEIQEVLQGERPLK